MTDPIVINLQLDGLDAVMSGMKQTSKAVGSVGSNVATASKQVAAAIGPFQRYVNAVQALNKTVPGTTAHADALYRVAQATKAVNTAQNVLNGPTFGSKLMRAVSSTRFGMGANGLSIMPLIGQTASLIGGPFGTAVTVAATALMGLAEASKAITQAFTDRSVGGYSVGTGNPADAAAARAIGAAAGNPDRGIDIVNRMKASAEENPYVAAQTGISPIGGPFGNKDRVRQAIQAMLRMKRMSPGSRARLIDEMGIPELGTALDTMSEPDLQGMIGQSAAPEPGLVRGQRRVRSQFENMAGRNPNVGALPNWFINTILPNLPGGEGVDLVSGAVGNSGSERPGKAVDKLTRSIDDLTDRISEQLRLSKQGGIYGAGSAMAGGSIPAMWRNWKVFDEAMRSHGLKLGAFTQ